MTKKYHSFEVVGEEPKTLDDELAEMENKKKSSNTSPFPSKENRPCYVVLKDWVKTAKEKYAPGVYFCGFKTNKDGEVISTSDTWICSYLIIEAITFDAQGNNFGRLLSFKPTVGELRNWSMPMELLAGDGSALRAELLAMGAELDPETTKRHLATYIQREHPKRNIRCVLQIGWSNDSYVLPDKTYGPNNQDVIYQSGERGHEEHTQAGTLDEWKNEISKYAIGNPLQVFAVAAAFAGPLLAKTNTEGGGFHFVGDSSTGKTTLIEVACSVWGGNSFKRSWRATANGMESVAALFNDGLLALDEISQCDPREVGSIIYALSNGRGKQRATRSGFARGVVQWKCMVLSSGERSIETSMYDGGQKIKAGQIVRLVDIPVDQKFGAWDEIHDSSTPASFSDRLKRASSKYYGVVGRAFVEKLAFDETDFCTVLEKTKSSQFFMASGTDGQEKRVAARFALVAVAGELATEYGLTGWPVNLATESAAKAFELWKTTRGKGNEEPLQIMRQLSEFLQRHGDSRFSDFDKTTETRTIDRAGWWSDETNHREYRLNRTGIHEALKGFDFKRALNVLVQHEVLPPPLASGEKARTYRINGQSLKLYPINTEKLFGYKDVT